MPTPDLTGQLVAVTGATGFLGRHITRQLLAAGATVRAVVRSPHKAEDLKAQGVLIAKADLAEPEALRAAFEGADSVVHNAALAIRHQAPWEDFERANVTGTENAMQAIIDAGVRRAVAISTIAVYKLALGTPHAEDTPYTDMASAKAAPRRWLSNWRYGMSKAAGERRAWELAEQHGLSLTTLRPGPVYGSGDHKATVAYKKLASIPVLVLPDIRVPQVHAADVAQAVCGALANPESGGRAYNVTGESVTLSRLVRAAREALGIGGLLLPIPAGRQTGLFCDDSAAERDLGFVSRSIEAGLNEAYGKKALEG